MKCDSDFSSARARTRLLMGGLLLLLICANAFPIDSPHGNLALDCQSCHVTTGWTEIRSDLQFDHDKQTQFPLVGRHGAVSCAECHSSLVFTEAGTQCLDCHADIHRGQFNDCEACHTPHKWVDERKFAAHHETTRFPLIGLHVKLDCQACHANGQYVNLPLDCAGCHLEAYHATTNPAHAEAGFSLDCAECHSVTTPEWKNARFEDHDLTDFPLTGAHVQTNCLDCHVGGQFAGTPLECYACHQEDYEGAEDHLAGGFPHACEECHNTSDWDDAEFNHNNTAFPLTGAHVQTNCLDCHVGGVFAGTPMECLACHEEDYDQTTNPEHRAELFPSTCEACHTTAAWSPAEFDNHDLTDFPLTGAHVQTNCLDCHVGGQFAGTPLECYACHQNDYEGAEDHVAQGYPQTCEVCHNTSDWDDAEFNHDNTEFPLTGAHVQTNCLDCHVGGVYDGTPMDCWSCHEEDYNGTEDPNHAAENYPQDCALCHNTVDWEETTFDHDNTDFPLTGAHVQTTCLDCHADGYTGTPTDCFVCHEADYNEAENHLSQGYPHDCAMCHNTVEWDGADFNHDNTAFPLTGSHIQTNCLECHVGGVFAGTPTDCWSCHEADYNGTDDPDHAAENYPQDCAICHNTVDWEETTFDHNNTDFPLTGAHVQTNCLQCHADGYTGTPTDCFACHEDDYNNAEDHLSEGYPHDCAMCHNTSDWDDANFDHNNTAFPLTGAHIQTNCLECHVGGVFEGTPTDCWSCHEEDYNDADDHVEDGYPHDCTMCHNTSDWEDGDFNHNNTDFPLTGAHIQTNCGECHVGGVFEGTPTDCWSCHEEDYNDADDHVEDSYPHDCTMCHNTSDWEDGDFNHNNTDFPLTGEHVEANCSECHIGGVFEGTPTDCWSCHQEDYEDADDHVEENFPHDCSMCHSTNDWDDDDRFSHDATQFPLTGAHAEAHCLACHVGGDYSALPLECISCHEADVAAATDPDHAAAGFSSACADCHDAVQWDNGLYDHSQTGFPLTGAHVQSQCIDCHTVSPYSATETACASCHQEDADNADDPDHSGTPFLQGCGECHNTTIWNDAQFDHSLADFPLTGAHLAAACAQCHVSGQYTGTATACFACHETDYNGTTNPDHTLGSFSHACEQCHSTVSWSGADFDHNLSDFPLTGAHLAAACTQCHVGGQYTGTPLECIACHQSDYDETVEPDHADAGFAADCADCHTTAAWSGVPFDHAAATGFALIGAHLEPTCSQCHTGGPFAATPSECIGCHLSDFENSINPNHSSAGYPTDCAQCHTVTLWSNGVFDHNLTDFPLTGAHAGPNCAECHSSGQFDGLNTDCFACHAADYDNSQDPRHGDAGFSTNCAECHTAQNWQTDFDHNATGFPLTGAHVAPSCVECHTTGLFSETASACLGCHEEDFNSVDDPVHTGQFPTSCADCHNTSAWDGADFDHSATSFPLTGAHVGANCAQCHVGGVFAGTTTDCYGCHQADYDGTDDPVHATIGFGTDCATCHVTESWDGAEIDHNLTGFPLTGTHVQTACLECHVGGQYSGTSPECVACHLEEFQSVEDPDHVSGSYAQDCAQCHGTAGWENASFDHDLSQFPLTGAHVALACVSCHINGYNGTQDQCLGCHLDDFTGAANPDHEGFSTNCVQCHTTSGWAPADFNHNLSDFPLTGAHVGASCTQCHIGGQYTGTPTACVACHVNDLNGTTNPDHGDAGFASSCNSCHTTTNWNASFNHNTTGFPLTGAHIEPTCSQCHTGGPYSSQSSECFACHEADYSNASNPNHAAGGYPTTCAQCHSTMTWDDADFDHALTDFPLTGAHVAVNCAQCHVGGQYAGTTLGGVACHESDYLAAAEPPHDENGLSTSCTECHSTASWSPSTFNHSATAFPLTGAHIAASCAQCHVGGQFEGTPTECLACHQPDYDNTSDPDHDDAGFGTACNSCHTTSSWDADFNHAATGFPLTGAHLSLACAQCHDSGPYGNQSSECFSCHAEDYNGATDPNHVSSGYPTDCAQCHNTSTWDDATFDHNLTGFPLTGAHVSANCTQCHVGGQYAGTPTECLACHQSDYDNTSDPDHGDAGLGTACNSCHSTTNWDANYDHGATGFPLTGAHLSVSCAQCHNTGPYSDQSSECLSCHAEDYNGATNPSHAGYPTTCQQCHGTSSWEGASFDHNTTDFPLTGAHVSISCTQCHVGGQFEGTPTECLACHTEDFNNTSDPDHGDAGFGTACNSCHTTSNWDAAFDHGTTGFPLTGAHVSLGCVQCHNTGPYSDQSSECFSCHAEDYNGATNPSHAGYPTTCQQCHGTSSWEGASFDHSTTDFPLTGAHISVSCTQCHVGGQYTGTPSDCYGCHAEDYAGADDPDHQALGFPLDCAQCHNTSNWEDADFDHNTTGFPLTGAHLNANCVECHVGGQYAGTPTDCYFCHEANYDAATPDHNAGYPLDCEGCHTTSNWSSSFNHDTQHFPIYSGEHRNEWDLCVECHVVPNNFTAFSCIECHEHDNQSEVDNDHDEVNGYTYTPTSCYACHPDGDELLMPRRPDEPFDKSRNRKGGKP